MDGEPPDLPVDRYSEAARNFVSGCLNKIPKLRPTYGMLLQHAWLAPLLKPSPIMEEDEDLAESTPTPSTESDSSPDEMPGGVVDKEVADWVKEAIERRRSGKMGRKEKPALHAAPLDVVGSPEVEKAPMGPVGGLAEVADGMPEVVEVAKIDGAAE